MADIVATAAKVSVIFKDRETQTRIAAVALTAGQPIYIDSNGKAAIADANGSGTDKFRGIALESVAAGQPVTVLMRGTLYGFALDAMAFDDPVYVSNTAGSLSTTAGGTSLLIGRVVPLADSKTINKVLHILSGFVG